MAKSLKIEVADRIKEILEKKGWKQADLVRETGFTKARISLILSGDRNLTLETVEILQKALKTPILKVASYPHFNNL
jgi:transcriptional regulator with XRE-family HTH domain